MHYDQKIIASIPVPETMADLLQMAIADGRRVDRGAYHPHYNHWLRMNDEQCQMCAAGAIMVASFGLSADEDDGFFSPQFGLPDQWQTMLRVTDLMRANDWLLAASTFYDDRFRGMDDLFGDRMAHELLGVDSESAVKTARAIEHKYRLSGKDRSDWEGIHEGTFVGWKEYDAWLEYAEMVVLPILRQHEQAILLVSAS